MTIAASVPIVAPNGQPYKVKRARASSGASEGELLALDTTVGALTATLSAAPNTGACIAVGDDGGSAVANPITVQPAGGVLIDGAVSYVLNRANAIEQFIFTGTQYERVVINRQVYDPVRKQCVTYVSAEALEGSIGIVIPGAANQALTSDGAGGVQAVGNSSVRSDGVALGDATTTATGANAFATGQDTQASAICSHVSGQDCSASVAAFRTIVHGHESHCTAPDCIVLGENNLVSQDGAIAIGYTCTVTHSFGVAIGAYCTVNAQYGHARGLAVTVSRTGEEAHGSGHSGVVGYRGIDLYRECNAAPDRLRLYDGSDYLLSQEVRMLKVYVCATKADGSVAAYEERTLAVKMLPGPAITIEDETATYSPAACNLAARGWTLTIAAVGGTTELRFTFDPGADNVKVAARVEGRPHIFIPS